MSRSASPPDAGELDAEAVAALVNGSHDLAADGRMDEAVRDLRRAVPAARRLFARDPVRHRTVLVVALRNLEGRLAATGRAEETVPLLREIVEATAGYRDEEVANGTRDALQSHRIGALTRLARRLRAAGDLDGAIAAATTARDESPRPADPPVPGDAAKVERLVACELLLGRLLEDAGRVEESIRVGESAAAHARLCDDTVQLADAALDLGLRLLAQDRLDDAAERLRQAVEAYRDHAEDPGRPDARANLAVAANRLGVALSMRERDGEAVPYFEEAVRQHRRRDAADPEVRDELAGSLRDLAVCLIQLDRDAEAVAALTESAELYRPAARDGSRFHRRRLAEVLNRLWRGLAILGREEESASVKAEWSALAGVSPSP
ncbi:tetratricopeptide repeat protein [Actinomadura sp. NBRC 104425]|uniref:tetratricopeptide repeat protein n=1 Tax=Actinomadura sp. NBRC 104425 TaxID=3032204 RepID=UPI0025574184|nr:tetratricopeptide repeat protein [Actinomadura sp. NBRC 104425]